MNLSKAAAPLILSLAMLGLAKASVVEMIKKQTGQEVVVVNQMPLKQDPSLKVVVLKEVATGFRVVSITNKEESFLVAIEAGFFTSNDEDRGVIISEIQSAYNYNASLKTRDTVKGIIDKLPAGYAITLSSTNPNPSKMFYIVSDPLCPHCQSELKELDKKLEKGDVHMIVVGGLGKESIKRAAEIQSLIKTAKTDKDKIKTLSTLYDPKYKSSKKVDTKVVEEVTRSLMGEGKVEGVPYIIEEDK